MSLDPIPRRVSVPPDDAPSVAVLHRPARRAGAPGVLFCGGFHSSMRGDKARALDARCAASGLACTRFDYRGHGESDGDAACLTLADWLADTLAVVDATSAERPGEGSRGGPLLLVGSSMGAWLAVLAALRRPVRVRALLLVAAAADFLHETLPARLDEEARARLERGLTARLATPYDPAGWPVSAALIDSGRELALLTTDAAAALRCPVRMLHGTADDTAPWERAASLLGRLGSDDATLELIRGGDHRLSTPRELVRLTRALDELIALLSR